MTALSVTATVTGTGTGTGTGGRFVLEQRPGTVHLLRPSLPLRTSHVVTASRNNNRNRRGSATPTKEEGNQFQIRDGVDGIGGEEFGDDEDFVVSQLPGSEPDFWEGEKWDGLGFFVQYLWAFGFGFALIACGIAVATYNQGAADFKETPAYKESVQSREFLEGPDASNLDVFESNPTEGAPRLD